MNCLGVKIARDWLCRYTLKYPNYHNHLLVLFPNSQLWEFQEVCT